MNGDVEVSYVSGHRRNAEAEHWIEQALEAEKRNRARFHLVGTMLSTRDFLTTRLYRTKPDSDLAEQ